MKQLALFALMIALVGCSERSPKLLPMPDYSKPVENEKLGEYVPFNPKVDILFIVDDSGSMGSHQANLIANIDHFVDGIANNQVLDYHIGVVTSSLDGYGKGKPGALVGNPPFVDRKTVGMKSFLRANLNVGTGGSGKEVFFETVVLAMTPQLSQGANFGFFRPDALLALFILTDTEDQGNVGPQAFYNALVSAKGGDATKVASYAVLIPPNDPSCKRDSSEKPPFLIQEFLRMVGGLEFNLCDPLFGANLAAIGDDILNKVGRVIPLKQIPVIESIRVTYGSQVIPNDELTGWVYDPLRNALVMAKDMDLKEEAPGTQMQVYFVPADL